MGSVWICNTDVESEWSTPINAEVPQKGIRQVIFNYFEEILLASAGPSNIAILRKEPDSEFTDYLKNLGIELPTILVAGESTAKPWLPTSQLAAQNTSLINILAKQVSEGKVDTLESFGVSKNIEKIAELSGLSISNSGSELSKSISRKSFSRTIAKKLEMHIPDGEVCNDSKKIIETVENVRSRNKGSPIVIKPDLGAAGRGQHLIKRQEDIDRLIASINHGNSGTLETTYVVERWHPNATTLSYEFHINRDGHVSTAILPRKSLMDEYGGDYGYVYPAKIEDKFLNEIKRASNVLGTELWKEYQYHGPVRCDALLLPDGSFFPVLELNARHSFFYFIDSLHKKLSNQPVGLFCWFFFQTNKALKFEKFIHEFIGRDLMFSHNKKQGVVVPIWGTVNAAERIKTVDEDSSLRRLFVFIISETYSSAINAAEGIRLKLDHGFG